ncbi:hypothetical protein [Tenacibaculum sp. M341]|uniref:hypothetical protein n=1 Tax=Tenacibaculum sp. M341 TaxID=2530339 RepID=UPI001046A1ED|nr:hypothetical protein [Tenacibaculum sp. M341]TCI93639.1 hypothetical protein EYW44_04295 [Tenacibaculum sp. M341]
MSLNQKINSNLKSLFLENFKEIQYASLLQWLDLLEVENPDIYSINDEKMVKLYDQSVIENFKLVKGNKKLLECYEKAIAFDINETEIINGFSGDLISSFEKIKKGIRKIEDSKIQIILLTYSFEPHAWISGFGEGNYPILEKPKHFDFNYKNDFFEMMGHVDYSKIWSNLIELEECLEEAEIFDDIFDTDFFQSLRNSYIYKTYLLLNKAFEQNKTKLFNGLDFKKPLSIYGHEHDCEKINVFCYE